MSPGVAGRPALDRGFLSPRHAVLMRRTSSAEFGSLHRLDKGPVRWTVDVTLGCLDSGGSDHRVVVDDAVALRWIAGGISCG